MKLVIAIIQPDKLDEVREALLAADISRITVLRASGHGRSRSSQLYRGQERAPSLSPKIQIEIACNDDFVDRICEVIMRVAIHSDGKLGDGKIFILPMEECVRIRTGEKGHDAI